MNIRRAQIEDLLEIGDMWEAMKEENANEFYKKLTNGEEKRSFMHFLSNWMVNQNYLIFVSEEQEVGGFIFSELQNMEHGNAVKVFCDKLYVKPQYRGTKMAHRLIEHTKDIAKKAGAQLGQFESNYTEADIKRWTKRGYKPIAVTFMKEL